MLFLWKNTLYSQYKARGFTFHTPATCCQSVYFCDTRRFTTPNTQILINVTRKAVLSKHISFAIKRRFIVLF